MSVKLDVDLKEATEIVAMLQEVAAIEHKEFRILDVGIGDRPLVFATNVVAQMPWNERAEYGYIPEEAGAGACRFKENDWRQVDICDDNWGWSDKYFDVVWCVDVLTSLRDPIQVVRKISRMGKVGYIRIPNKNYESLYNVDSGHYVGYGMNRWFADVMISQDDKPFMLFTYKHPNVNNPDMYEPNPIGDKYTHIWWTGDIEAAEVHYPNNDAFEKILKSWELEYNNATQ